MYSDPFSSTTPAAAGIDNPDCVKWRETLPSQEKSAGIDIPMVTDDSFVRSHTFYFKGTKLCVGPDPYRHDNFFLNSLNSRMTVAVTNAYREHDVAGRTPNDATRRPRAAGY